MVAWFIPFLAGIFASAVLAPAFSPAQTRISQLFAGIIQPNLPDPFTLVTLRWRGKISEETFYALMRANGFSRENADLLYQSQERVLDAGALVSAKWRGIIDELKFYEEMEKIGFTRENAELYEKVMQYFPSPSDLIRFAIREVYTPEIVEKYRMLEDLPPKFLEEAAKAGIPEEQAKRYWAAHWNLPSLSEGFEMFHRGVITEEELKTLMRALDIMPGWRDKLIQIAYTPYTRVDIRRMYACGVLSREDVKKAYKDLGYDDEKAEKLTEFTVRYEAREEIKAASEPIIAALRAKEISPDEAFQQLKSIGMNDEQALLTVQREVAKMENAEREKWVEVLSDLYVRGVLPYDQFVDNLGKLNLSADAIEQIIAFADLEKMKRRPFPSLSDLRRWWAKGLLDEAGVREIMKRMNYDDATIDMYIRDWSFTDETVEPKLPSKEDIRLWLRKKIIDVDTARALLAMHRYPEMVIDWYIKDWVGS